MEPAQSELGETVEAGRHAAEVEAVDAVDERGDVEDGAPAAPRVPEGYRDGTLRARIAQGALAVNAVLYVAMLATFVFDPLGVQSELAWTLLDAFWEIATPLEICLRIATAIAFLTWLHRASSNAHAFADPIPQHSPGAAVGFWFVPCANVWLPYQVVSELDRVSDPEGRGVPSGWTAGWWAAWVGSNVVSRFATSSGSEPSVTLSLTVIALHLVAAVLAVVVVEQIAGNQRARAHRADPRAIADVFR